MLDHSLLRVEMDRECAVMVLVRVGVLLLGVWARDDGLYEGIVLWIFARLLTVYSPRESTHSLWDMARRIRCVLVIWEGRELHCHPSMTLIGARYKLLCLVALSPLKSSAKGSEERTSLPGTYSNFLSHGIINTLSNTLNPASTRAPTTINLQSHSLLQLPCRRLPQAILASEEPHSSLAPSTLEPFLIQMIPPRMIIRTVTNKYLGNPSVLVRFLRLVLL